MAVRLQNLLKKYPTVRLATEADNAKIREFFEQAPMRTPKFDIRYRRAPEFFKLLRMQGHSHFVFLGEGPDGHVQGTGTLALRDAWLDNQPILVGIWSDLRVSPNRKNSILWRNLFRDLISQCSDIEEFGGCQHFYTLLLDDNREAIRALTSSKRQINQPQYIPLASFQMRNLMLRLPFPRAWRTKESWSIRRALDGDLPSLDIFFTEENQKIPFGFRESISDRLMRWEGLSVWAFVCAFDEQGLVACFAPWSPVGAKQTWVSKIPLRFRLMKRALAFIPKIPLRIPSPGEALHAPCLTHLTFASRLKPSERVAVFKSMLHSVFDQWDQKDWHFVSLCDFDSWGLGKGLGGFLQQTVPITVYAVLPPGEERPNFCSPSQGAVGFEMALV